ncbi:MAG: hypothetical protein MK129_08145, partial [SAR116 cluster bacterium]|nr:hypothetical protein [SAR116 cluster bacterium]
RIPTIYELARFPFCYIKVNFLPTHGYTAVQQTGRQATGDDTPPGNLPAGNVSSPVFTLD